jgi:hypothetical protein
MSQHNNGVALRNELLQFKLDHLWSAKTSSGAARTARNVW